MKVLPREQRDALGDVAARYVESRRRLTLFKQRDGVVCVSAFDPDHDSCPPDRWLVTADGSITNVTNLD